MEKIEATGQCEVCDAHGAQVRPDPAYPTTDQVEECGPCYALHVRQVRIDAAQATLADLDTLPAGF